MCGDRSPPVMSQGDWQFHPQMAALSQSEPEAGSLPLFHRKPRGSHQQSPPFRPCRPIHVRWLWTHSCLKTLSLLSKLKHLCWPDVPNPAESSIATWHGGDLKVRTLFLFRESLSGWS